MDIKLLSVFFKKHTQLKTEFNTIVYDPIKHSYEKGARSKSRGRGWGWGPEKKIHVPVLGKSRLDE